MRSAALTTVALVIALQVPSSGFQVPERGTGTRNPEPVRTVVSRADLIYTTPVSRSEDGIPIGNGQIGALVWTTPSALKVQIARVDIPPIELDLAGAGADVFTADGTHQRLSIYEGRLDVNAAGVNARILAWPERDVIAIEVEDRRAVPEPIQINIAASQIAARGGRIVLTQEVQKGDRRATSAVAIALLGRKTFTRVTSETEARIVSPGERGRVVILIASAATHDPGQNVAAMALSHLDASAAKSFDDLVGDNAEWWYGFWQRSTIAMDSADGIYNLYLTHATGSPSLPRPAR